MSVQRLKTTIVKLQRKRNKRCLAVRRLQEEHDKLLRRSKAIDLLVQHQDTVARMLHLYFKPADAPPLPSIADDTGFIEPVLYQWELMANFQTMRLADYNWLLAASAQQVRARIVDHLQQLALLKNSWVCCPSAVQQAALDSAVCDILHLTKAMYILTPRIAYQLKDVNLLTGCLEPLPEEHWERAFLAAEASQEQLAIMQEVLQQVVPKLERLEEERLELAACINSVKALSLHEQAAQARAAAKLQQQQQQQQQQLVKHAEQQQRQQQQQEVNVKLNQPQERVGVSRSAGLRRAAARRAAAAAAAAAGRRNGAPATLDTNESGSSIPAGRDAVPAGYYTTLLQEATAASPAAANGPSRSGAANASSGAALHAQRMCRDVVADLDTRLLAWRTLSGARSAVTFVLRAEQLASILLAAFPYLPMTGCLCDYVPAAQAAAAQREQQRQEQQEPDQ